MHKNQVYPEISSPADGWQEDDGQSHSSRSSTAVCQSETVSSIENGGELERMGNTQPCSQHSVVQSADTSSVPRDLPRDGIL